MVFGCGLWMRQRISGGIETDDGMKAPAKEESCSKAKIF
jgi:hypothetical protein